MCVNKLLINAFPNSHRKIFQPVTWALRLYHSREGGWLYSSTNWLLALLSNWIHRPTGEWNLNLLAGQDCLSLHLPSVHLLRAGDEGTCPEDCCQWAAPLGAGSLDSRAVSRHFACRFFSLSACLLVSVQNTETAEEYGGAAAGVTGLLEALQSELFQQLRCQET